MNFLINKEIKILSLAFLFIFLGFSGVQQYVTSFFSEIGIIEVGFRSLILTYLFFTISDPLAGVFVSKYGAKRSMIIGSFFYFVFILSLLAKDNYFIYFASALLGIGASMLWTGQNTFLIRASKEKSYGKDSGFFSFSQSIGAAVGVFFIGFLIERFLFRTSFLFFSIFPLVGFFLLFSLKDIREKQEVNHFKLLKKSIVSITALKLALIYFSVQFIYGLAIGIIPIEIKKNFSLSYVGILSSLFWILPLLFTYFFGKLSDIKGRKQMIIISYAFIMIGLILLYVSETPIFLIAAIIFIALSSAIMKPTTFALVGDVSTGKNLEFITALFWMSQTLGVLISLFFSQMFQSQPKNIYLISMFVVTGSLVILLPFFRLRLEEMKERLSREIS